MSQGSLITRSTARGTVYPGELADAVMPLDSADKGAAVREAGFTIARVSFGVLAASMLAAATLAAPAAGPAAASTCPPSGKCFAVTVSPTSPAAGATTVFTFKITNEAATQRLGSVQITAPAGFVITGAPGSKSFTPSSALFVNLGLNPPATTTTLTVNAILGCSGGSYQWGIEAKQSNDFSGSGNDFQLDPASAANLSGSATGSCSLAFTSDGEPADTVANAVITSLVDSKGGPVKVEVLDGSGNLVTGSTAAVTVAIGSNPGAGSLSGTLTVNASGGIASFSDLSINQQGDGYTLTATSPGLTPARPSGSFNISGSSQPSSCSSPCTVSSSTTTTSATVTTTTPIPPGDFLTVGIGGVDYACAGTYTRVSDPVTFNVLSPSGVALSSARFTVTLDINKSAVLASGRTGAAQWQICYASTQQFTAQPGTSGTAVIGGVTYNTGLLPGCSNTQGAPCVQARHKDMAGDVIVTFLASGDPVGWG